MTAYGELLTLINREVSSYTVSKEMADLVDTLVADSYNDGFDDGCKYGRQTGPKEDM